MIRDIGSSAFGARRNKAGPASRSTTRRLRYAMLSFLTLSTVIMASIATQSAPVGATTNWSPTTGCGIVDTTVVPPFVYSMTVTVVGGSGGQASYGTWGGTEIHTPGYGGTVTSTIAVTPGQTISAIIGCEGADFPSSDCSGNPARPPASSGWSTGGAGAFGDDGGCFGFGGSNTVGTGAGGASSAVCIGEIGRA